MQKFAFRDTIGANNMISWFAGMHRELPGFFKLFLIFSFVSNLLMLIAPLYMLQIYDRILTSGSTDTLIWITVISVFLLLVYAAAEAARRRICLLAAGDIEDKISERIFLKFGKKSSAGERLPGDLMVLGRLRSIFQDQIILPFFDLPFAPFFLMMLFLIHPLLGLLGFIGGAVLLALAIIAERKTRSANQEGAFANTRAFELVSGFSRQRSAIVAMGLLDNALFKWREAKRIEQSLNLNAGTQEGLFTAGVRSGRQILQILILGVGAALAIAQEISPGAIVAGSIILSRALAPIDQIVGSWRAIARARGAWEQLEVSLDKVDAPEEYTPLPAPQAKLVFDRLSVSVPGADGPLVHPFSVEFTGGQMIAVVGPIGSGKTTLLQTISGAWQPRSGDIRLGARNIHDWPSKDRGPYVGYVPQNIELLPGTVGENIGRMGPADPEAIIDASRKAGAHEMILGLPNGYDTPVSGSGSKPISSGQRQLIGLARALFGDPVLLLLDEPTANLDPEASEAAAIALREAIDRGAIAIVSTHDERIISLSKSVLAIRNGSVSAADSSKFLELIQRKDTVDIRSSELST